MNSRTIALWLGMMGGVGALAQSPGGPMTLQGCLNYALEHNPSSTVFENQVVLAQKKATESLSGYLPQVNGQASFDDNLKRPTTIIPAGVFSPTEIRLQMGSQYSSNAVVQLDQVAFDMSMLVAGEANRANVEMADLNVLKNNEDIVYNTAISYYQVLIAGEQRKLLAQNAKKYEDLLAVLKLQYEKGVAKKMDYDRVRVAVSNIRSQVNLVETSRALALNRLKVMMGMDANEYLEVEDSVHLDRDLTMPAPAQEFDPSPLVDYRLQEKGIEMMDLNLQRRKGAYFPTLSVYARYGAQSFGNEFGNSFENWFDYSAIGVKMNVPIFAGFRRSSQVQQSELELVNARLSLQINERNFQLRYQNAYTQLMSSYTNFNMTRENLVLAKEVFETTSFAYQKGAVMLADFLNADYAFKEAQTNYITALLNFLSARLDFEKSQGSLSDYISHF